MYPLKIMGRNTEEFRATVESIIGKHVPESTGVCYSSRLSSGGKYLSITANFLAESQEQLKGIYADLASNSSVLIAL